MNINVAKSDKLKTLLSAIVLAAIVLWIGQPAVDAATRAVRVKGKVKSVGTKSVGDTGDLGPEGVNGVMDVRTFAGGNGFLGAGDCSDAPTAPLPSTLTLGEEAKERIVTGILFTGTDGLLTVTAAAIGNNQVPLLQFRATPESPNTAFALGNGLSLSAPITFTCTGTNGNFVVIGQGE